MLELEQANGDLARSREETLRRLAMAAEFKDPETAEHLERMSQYATLLAHRYGLDRQRFELIRLASPMHDVGKIGIPDAVLMKAGRFDEHDREVMNRHPEIGHRILSGSSSELLDLAATIAPIDRTRSRPCRWPASRPSDRPPRSKAPPRADARGIHDGREAPHYRRRAASTRPSAPDPWAPSR